MRPIVSVARPARAAQGISYDPAAKPKSDLYRDLLPLINGRCVDLLYEPRLLAQLCGLERRSARGGRDTRPGRPQRRGRGGRRPLPLQQHDGLGLGPDGPGAAEQAWQQGGSPPT
jgi:hypothetical protein